MFVYASIIFLDGGDAGGDEPNPNAMHAYLKKCTCVMLLFAVVCYSKGYVCTYCLIITCVHAICGLTVFYVFFNKQANR